MKISLTINGESKSMEIQPGEILLDLLRREGYYGVKRGCDDGHCGACAVIIDGQSRDSCLTFAAQVDGCRITTIEGIGTPEAPHPIQEELVHHGGIQCGYCVPGMVVSAKALMDRNPDFEVDDLKQAWDGHLCRCTGYVKQVEAVMAAKETARKEKTGGER